MAIRKMSTEPQRTCPSCGNEFSEAMEFCPVCMLQKALPGAAQSGASSFAEAIKPTSEQRVQRYEHYELITGEDGKPIELGRGAMGVTYKAFDINLRCPVTLKVISGGTSVMNRRGFAFCVKHAQLRGCDIQMLPPSCTWAQPVRITSMRWSSWRVSTDLKIG